MKPHKHAEVIRAYADGAKIQYRRKNSEEWQDIEHPVFAPESQYRVKPEPRKGWYRVALMNDGSTFTADVLDPESEVESLRGFIHWITPRIEFQIE